MPVSLNKENVTHNLNNLFADGKNHKLNKTLNVSFEEQNKDQIDHIKELIKEQCVFSLDEEIIESIAKVKVAVKEYLKYWDYEYAPNDEDLKDFTNKSICDEDIDRYKKKLNEYIPLSTIVTNDFGEKDQLSETISDNREEEIKKEDLVYESINLLPKIDKELLMCKFGLGGLDELDNKALAKRFHISIKEVESRVNKALNNMKCVLLTMI